MAVNDLFDLSGKVALVTGGGRGIGKTIARAYAEAGARLAICGRREEWLTPTYQEFQAAGFECISLVADVTKEDEVDQVVKEVLDKYGQIDILVNNAGQSWGQATEEMPL